MYYSKLCSVRKNTYNNDQVHYVAIFEVMSSVSGYDRLVKKTKAFNTIEQAKQAAINNQFGV